MNHKKSRSNLPLILIFLVGLALLIYPSFSNYWNQFHSSRAISSYSDTVAQLDRTEYEAMLSAAAEYNLAVPLRDNPYAPTAAEKAAYPALLDAGGTGIMGYIEIEKLDVSLPIYHGTADSVLQSAVGHLDWTSLPVGGESTHCVLSGHRGLPSARLFTDLDKLSEGDEFCLNILDETFTYQVDLILIVEPTDTEALQIVPGCDLCTLVTCTPYGINSHRLLVRGHRVDNAAAPLRVTADAMPVEPLLVASVLAIPLMLILLAWLLLTDKRRQ